MLSAPQAALVVAGALACFFALKMLFERTLYAAAIWFMAVLMQGAAFFFFSGAPLLAFLQIMIYAGAVMSLVVITIMAAPSAAAKRLGDMSLGKPLAFLVILIPAAELALFIGSGGFSNGALGGALAAENSLGAVLFQRYAAATELVTALLFLAGLGVLQAEPKQ